MNPTQSTTDLAAFRDLRLRIKDVQAALGSRGTTTTFMAVGCGDRKYFKIITARTVILRPSHSKGPDIIAEDGTVFHAFDLGLVPKLLSDGSEAWNPDVICFPLNRWIRWRIIGALNSLGTDGARNSLNILRDDAIYS